jgi:type IV secretion system protein VirB10
MSSRFLVLLTLVGLMFAPPSAASQNATPPSPTPAAGPAPVSAPTAAQASAAAPAKGHVDATASRWSVPIDTTIPLELKNTLSSRTAYVGQAIYCETIYPITVGNRIVIPVGTYVKGAVTQVVRPGRVKGRAQIGLRFESITLPDGTTRQMRATLSSFAGNGEEGFHRQEAKVEGASSKGQDAGKIAQTTVAGAEIGTIAGAAKGSVGKGLGIGTAAGALGGLIWVLATRGKDIVLPPGTSLELQLSQPLNFERDEVEAPSPYQEGPALPRRDPGPSL